MNTVTTKPDSRTSTIAPDARHAANHNLEEGQGNFFSWGVTVKNGVG